MRRAIALAWALAVAAPAFGQALPLRDGDYVINPPFAAAPELTVQAGVPVGALHEFVMKSQDSKAYPGIKRIDNDYTRARDQWGNRVAPVLAEQQSVSAPYERKVVVYVPRQYVPGTTAPFIVVQDGGGYVQRMATILDNLIAAGRVPAMVAIFIDSGGGDAMGSQRGLEYDTVSARYADFVEHEVLPRVSKNYRLRLTRDPDGRATMGVSSGGAAALTMAWFRPNYYRRVLSYSGTFVNKVSPIDPAVPHGAWTYHEKWIRDGKRKPLRIWLEVGGHDNHYTDPEISLNNWVIANQRTAAALKAKGYPYQYVFATDAGHVERKVVDQTLPGALEWLWQGYPRARARR